MNLGILDWLNSGATPETKAQLGLLSNPATASQGWDQIFNAQRALQSVPAQMAMGLAPFLHTVYHGSPHTFDAFDISKVGTGEGAQAYGHGMYFAENPGTANFYKNALGFQVRSISNPATGEVIRPQAGTAEAEAMNWLDYIRDAVAPTAPDAYIYQSAIQGAHGAGDTQVASVLQQWQKAGFQMPQRGGNLYKADIPDELIPKMLDWEKPLSQQSQFVQDAINRNVPQSVRTASDPLGPRPDIELLGSELYQKMMRAGASNAGALPAWAQVQRASPDVSKSLLDMGIPGIRYLDQGSRGAGQGTYNYVLFNPSVAKILSRE